MGSVALGTLVSGGESGSIHRVNVSEAGKATSEVTRHSVLKR